MRAFLIDPDARTITECTVQESTIIRDLCGMIGANLLDQARITRTGDQAWVSDTGLIDGLTRFQVSTYGGPLAGKAVVIGCHPYGEPRDAQISLEELAAMVRFS